jgi:hypothetical protein
MLRVVRQPGDGACLFHSLALGHPIDGIELRTTLARFIRDHPSFRLGDQSVADWVAWECGISAQKYAQGLERGWRVGGMLEVGLFAHIFGRRVLVFDGRNGLQVEPMAAVGPEGAAVQRIVWTGGHYDALVWSDEPVRPQQRPGPNRPRRGANLPRRRPVEPLRSSLGQVDFHQPSSLGRMNYHRHSIAMRRRPTSLPRQR